MKSKTAPTSSRHWPAKIGLLVGSLLVALLLAEGGARLTRIAPAVKSMALTDDHSVYRRSENPLLAYELKPNYRNEEADCVTSYPSTNAFGLRDRERVPAKPPGVRRILLLGDSVVEGVGIRALEDTLAGQLERLFPDGHTEVLNFGISGYNTRAEVELLATRGLSFAPDWVVLVFVGNDFDNFNREAFQLAVDNSRPAWAEGLFLRSHLFRWACLRANWFQFAAEQDPVAWNRQAMGDNNVVQGLARLQDLSERHGFRPLITIWPRFTDTAVEDWLTLPDQPETLVVEALARDLGIPTLRLTPAFNTHWQHESPGLSARLLYSIGDQMHPSVLGCAVAAQAIQKALSRTPPVKRPKPTTPSSAVQAAQALGTRAPSYARVHYNQGRTLEAQGQIQAAIGAYRQAIEADPEFEKAYGNLAVLLGSRGELNEAITLLRRAIAVKPYYADAHANLGIALNMQGQGEEGLQCLEEAVRLKPDSATYQHNLGEALLAARRPREACAHFARALELDPDLIEARLNLGICLAQQGRLQQAADQFRYILQRQPGHAEAKALLDKVLKLLAETEK